MGLSIQERISLRDDLLNQFKLYSVNRMSRNNFNRAFKCNPELQSKYSMYVSEFRSEDEAIYCLRYRDDFSNHICPICRNTCEFYINVKRKHYEYRKTCNNKTCIGKINHSEESTQKHKETCKRLYGDENYTNREQAFLTCLLLYGDSHYTNREQAKLTCLNRYGYEWLFQSPDFRKTLNEYYLKNFGVNWYVETEEFKEKSKVSKKSRYGNEYYNNIKQIIETNQRLRNCNWPMQNSKVIQTWRESYHRNHSIINPILITEIQPLLSIIKDGLTLTEAYSNNEFFKSFIQLIFIYKNRLLYINEIQKIIGFTYAAIDQRIHELELEEYFDIKDSTLEVQFRDFLINNKYTEDIHFERHLFSLQTDHNTRQQLDFLFKSHKVAFEINDTLTHNIINKHDQYYHYNKTIMSKDQHDIRLIHIWEWELNNDKILNWVLHILNQNKIQLDIKDCNVKNVSKEGWLKFLNQYSLSNNIDFDTYIGIYYNNELIEVLSFKGNILSICVKFGYELVKGTKEIIQSYMNLEKLDYIFTYVDLSKFTGKTFEDIGFKLLEYKEPNLIGETTNEIAKTKLLYNCGYNIYIMYN